MLNIRNDCLRVKGTLIFLVDIFNIQYKPMLPNTRRIKRIGL